MKLLAIDTSSIACSAAVRVGDQTIARYEEQPREHTRILLPMISDLLAESATELGELDAIILGNGPGSFIGMRIAASVAQGLAFASGLKVVPVSSMAAVAARVLAGDEAEEVVVTQDAHMKEVYLGVYRLDDEGNVGAVIDETLHGLAPIEALDPGLADKRVAAGFGWQRYPELLAANRDRFSAVSEVLYPHASDLLAFGATALTLGKALDPQDIVPAYLRQKVAEKPGHAS